MKAVKDSAIYLIGELVSRSVPFLLIPYISRKLGVEGFGELSYYQTFLALFFIIVGLSQEGAITRYFYVYGKRSLRLAVTAGYMYTLISGTIIIIGSLIVQSELLVYITLCAIFQSLVGVQLSIRQCQKQPKSYVVLQFLSSVSSVIFTIVLLELFKTDLVEKRIIALLLANMLVFVVAYTLYAKKMPARKFEWRYYQLAFSYILGFGVPLILHNASLFLKGQLDRVFIYHQFSQMELGLYAMGAQLASILMLILIALNKACTPYLFEGLKSGKITIEQIHKWALYSFILVPIPSLVVWMIPEGVFTWALGKEFLGTKYYIMLFLISITLSIPYFILVNYLFFHAQNKWISLCSTISTIVYVVSLVALTFTQIKYVPYAGILGSAVLIPILYIITSRVEKTV